MFRVGCLLLLTSTLLPLTCQAADVETVLEGLTNPSGVSFGPNGELTVCDATGKVIVVKDGKPRDFVTGFETEYWKTSESGEKSYKLGPLSAVWVGSSLAVTDAGLGDGSEVVRFYDGPGEADDGDATNSVPPTTDDPADKGEGNLTGVAVSANSKRLFVCGQGFDGKSWILSCNVANRKLKPFLSADEAGIETNSPMQVVTLGNSKILALYSGKGGAEDGLIVEWDLKTKKPTAQWKLPGLINPMGMARIGENRYAVTENNWSLTEVREGKIAIVTLGESGEAKVDDTGVKLWGPVSCAMGPDKKLYVTQLGKAFDAPNGSVVAISGLESE